METVTGQTIKWGGVRVRLSLGLLRVKINVRIRVKLQVRGRLYCEMLG